MINRTIQLEDISGIPGAGASGTALITCPRGYKYKRITLIYGDGDSAVNTAPPLANIGEIQVRLGGGIQRRMTATQLDAINTLNGAAFTSRTDPINVIGSSRRHLCIHFEEPWRTRVRNNSVDPNALGLKTLWAPPNKPLQIAVTFPLNAAATFITAEAEVTDDDDGQPSPFIRWNSDAITNTATLASASNLDLGLQKDDRLIQISTFVPAANLVGTRLEFGSVVVKQDQTQAALVTELTVAGMNPAGADAILAGNHIVFDKNDALDDAPPVGFSSSILKYTLTGAGAGTLPSITQVFGAPNRS